MAINDVFKLAGKAKRAMSGGKRKVLIITPLGERRRERIDLPPYQWKILDELHESPATVQELARQTGLSIDKVKKACSVLKNSGYIQVNSSEYD
jgi:DNA-binding MarR family transcriptional regulator